MKAAIVQIGNSRGIRIPKAILEQCHMEKDVELIVEADSIIIKPGRQEPRKDWGKHFKRMNETGDDSLIIPDRIDLAAKGWEW